MDKESATTDFDISFSLDALSILSVVQCDVQRASLYDHATSVVFIHNDLVAVVSLVFHLNAIAHCSAGDIHLATIHLEVLTNMNGVIGCLEDIDGLDCLLDLQILLCGNGMVGIACHIECACT